MVESEFKLHNPTDGNGSDIYKGKAMKEQAFSIFKEGDSGRLDTKFTLRFLLRSSIIAANESLAARPSMEREIEKHLMEQIRRELYGEIENLMIDAMTDAAIVIPPYASKELDAKFKACLDSIKNPPLWRADAMQKHGGKL